jgi:hypothetical protein
MRSIARKRAEAAAAPEVNRQVNPPARGFAPQRMIHKSPMFMRSFGGREGIRTPDPLLAKQVLSQLSYTPEFTLTLSIVAFRPLRCCEQ